MTKHREGKHPLDTLQEIRSLMERSSRFISLSGLSGVTAGLFALAGAGIACWYLGIRPFDGQRFYYDIVPDSGKVQHLTFFILDALFVLCGALAGGIYFTTRKARQKDLPIWDALTRRLLLNLAIPLLAGAVFILAMLYHGLVVFVAPATLLFYGLGLVNASKYTLNDIRYLGLTEIALGLFGVFIPGYGLELWMLGFGLLHIMYGAAMYFKYESGRAEKSVP